MVAAAGQIFWAVWFARECRFKREENRKRHDNNNTENNNIEKNNNQDGKNTPGNKVTDPSVLWEEIAWMKTTHKTLVLFSMTWALDPAWNRIVFWARILFLRWGILDPALFGSQDSHGGCQFVLITGKMMVNLVGYWMAEFAFKDVDGRMYLRDNSGQFEFTFRIGIG